MTQMTAPRGVLCRISDAAIKLFAERGVTRVSVSELASAAGVARGTIYNNLPDPDALFESVAAQLGGEMHARVAASFAGFQDPAERLAYGIRFFVRRAHEEPHWGRFLARFALSETSLQQVWGSQMLRDMTAGIQQRRYAIQPEQLDTAMNMVAGSVLGAMFLMLEGHKGWREAGTDIAEFVLVALGLSRHEARDLASRPLPQLASLPAA